MNKKTLKDKIELHIKFHDAEINQATEPLLSQILKEVDDYCYQCFVDLTNENETLKSRIREAKEFLQNYASDIEEVVDFLMVNEKQPYCRHCYYGNVIVKIGKNEVETQWGKCPHCSGENNVNTIS